MASRHLDNLKALSVPGTWRYLITQSASFWLVCIYLFFEYVRPQSVWPVIDVLPWSQTLLLLCAVTLLMETTKLAIPTVAGTSPKRSLSSPAMTRRSASSKSPSMTAASINKATDATCRSSWEASEEASPLSLWPNISFRIRSIMALRNIRPGSGQYVFPCPPSPGALLSKS